MACVYDNEKPEERSLLHVGSLDVKHSRLSCPSCMEYQERPQIFSSRRSLAVHLVFFSLYVVVSLVAVLVIPIRQHVNSQIYTPAEDAIKSVTRYLDGRLFNDNPYNGDPSPRLEAAWNALFENSMIRLSSDELLRLNRSSTLVQDGSGDFLGALDMYHQLHCVRYIHQYIHPEYYKMPETNVKTIDHADHCIDMLRQVVMCHADPAVTTFSYHPDFPSAWPEFSFEHQCRSWESLDAWAAQPGRAIDLSRRKELTRNPNYVGGMFDGHESPLSTM